MADNKGTKKDYDRWESTCIKFTDKPKKKSAKPTKKK